MIVFILVPTVTLVVLVIYELARAFLVEWQMTYALARLARRRSHLRARRYAAEWNIKLEMPYGMLLRCTSYLPRTRSWWCCLVYSSCWLEARRNHHSAPTTYPTLFSTHRCDLEEGEEHDYSRYPRFRCCSVCIYPHRPGDIVCIFRTSRYGHS